MCMRKKMIAFTVLLGFLITVATSLVPNMYVIGEFPYVKCISTPVVGVGYWGVPLPWMKQVVYPGAPKQIIPSHFILDVVFWIVIVFVIKLFYLTVIKGQKPKSKAIRKARRKKKKRKPKRGTRRTRRR